MKIWALRILVCALFAIGLSLTAATASAQTASGVIKVGKVDGGEVYRLTSDGQSIALKIGDTVVESDTVQTGHDSSVVLVFANGSSVRVGSDSKLMIEQFKMDPLDEDIAISRLTNEPSVSQTALRLDYGEMVGDVKKLNKTSNFNIKTPVGAAGIRGTQFRIVFRPTGDGRAFTFQLSTAEGLVVFEGTTQGGANALPVGDQQEIVVTAEVDTTTGQITISAPQAAAPISTEAAAQISTSVTTEIAPAIQATVISTNDQQQAASNTPPSSSNDNNSQPQNQQPDNTNPSNDQSNTPPATNPPATNPPATNPPATNPPATNPPATNPPATNPPATNPPANTPRNPQLTPGAGG